MNTPNPSPLEILLKDFLPEEQHAATEQQVGAIQSLPEVKLLRDLKTPIYGNDPNEIIKHRFLYRGGICLLCGPTGIGKSSLVMQIAIYLSIGKPIFGIVPGETFQEKA